MLSARSYLTICLLCGVFAIAGCTQPLNDRPTLGGLYTSPTLRLGATPQIRRFDPLLGEALIMDRSRWGVTQFIVPYDGVVHAQTLRIEPPLRHSNTARVYGRYPSVISALDPQSRSWGQDLRFAVSELGRSVIGTPFLIVYFGWNGELIRPSVSPSPYKRTRQDDWSSGSPKTDSTHETRTHD